MLSGGWTENGRPGNAALDLIDVYYLKNRLRRWFQYRRGDRLLEPMVPLYSMVGVRAAFAIGPAMRRSDYIPFEVMRACSADLAKMAFSSGRWAEDLLRDLPDAQDFRATIPPPASSTPDPQAALRRQWQSQRLEQNRQVFERILGAPPDHPAFEILDRKVALEALQRVEELSLHARIRFYGAVTAAIWLGGEESNWRVAATGAS